MGAPRKSIKRSSLTIDFKGQDPIFADEDNIAESAWYCFIISIEVLANVVAIGLKTDLRCRHNCVPEHFTFWENVDSIFTALSIVDVVLTMALLRPRRYFTGSSKGNKTDLARVADVIIVALGATDVFVMRNQGTDVGFRNLTAFRVAHFANFAVKMQLTSGFRELWLIFSGMKEVLKTVLWVIALLILMLWVFAIIVTITTSDDTYDFSGSAWTQQDYWGSVFRSCFSLFQVLTRDKWSRSAVWPVVVQTNGMIIFFVIFLSIGIFIVLNTIVGTVVESSLRTAKDNEEKQAQLRAKADQKILSSLKKIFMEADTDGNGLLELEELEEAMKTCVVKRGMAKLGIPIRDLSYLFAVLDEENKGYIDAGLFWRCCTRLRGPAMAKDLNQLSMHLDRNSDQASRHIRILRETNDHIGKILDDIDTIDLDIVQDNNDLKDPLLMARRARTRVSKSKILRVNFTGEHQERSDAGSEVAMDFGSDDSTPSKVRAPRRASHGGPGGPGGPGRVHARVSNSRLRHASNETQDNGRDTDPPPPPPLPKTMLAFVLDKG